MAVFCGIHWRTSAAFVLKQTQWVFSEEIIDSIVNPFLTSSWVLNFYKTLTLPLLDWLSCSYSDPPSMLLSGPLHELFPWHVTLLSQIS